MKLNKYVGLMAVLGCLSFFGGFTQNLSFAEGSGHSGGGGEYNKNVFEERCGTPSIEESAEDVLSVTTENTLTSSKPVCVKSNQSKAPAPKVMIDGIEINGGAANDEFRHALVARTAIRLNKQLCYRNFYGKGFSAGIQVFVKP